VSPFDFTNAAPVDRGWIPVLLVAGDHAALATDALRHVEVEPILFSGREFAHWNQRLRLSPNPHEWRADWGVHQLTIE